MERKVYFYSPDGVRLCGILTTPSAKTDRCVILCHGLGEGKNEWGGFHRRLSDTLVGAGFATFRFDFRGNGESGGKSIDICTTGEAEDITSAILFIKKAGYRRLGIVGTSFACGPVLLVAPKYQGLVRSVVLEYALVDYNSILKPKFAWPKKAFGKQSMQMLKEKGYFKIYGERDSFKLGQKFMDDVRRLKPWKEMRKLWIPILYIHGDKDDKVPYADSVKYSKLGKNSRLETIKGSVHGPEGKDAPKVKRIIANFFENTV